MNVVVFDDLFDGRRGTVAGDEADLCRSCDIFLIFVFVCRVLFLSYHYLSLPVEGVRSVVYVVFFSVCDAVDIW